MTGISDRFGIIAKIINQRADQAGMAFSYHKQETGYTCGASAMRMALESIGIRKNEKQVARMLGTNKVRGTWLRSFPQAAEKLRLDYVVKRDSTIEELKRYQKKGYVIIVDYLVPAMRCDHYSVIRRIGSGHIFFWDPWFGPEHKYKISHFKRIWRCDKRYEPDKAWFIGIKKA